MNKNSLNGLLFLIAHILFFKTAYTHIIESVFEFFIIILIPVTIMMSVSYFLKATIPHKKETQITLEKPKNQWGR